MNGRFKFYFTSNDPISFYNDEAAELSFFLALYLSSQGSIKSYIGYKANSNYGCLLNLEYSENENKIGRLFDGTWSWTVLA